MGDVDKGVPSSSPIIAIKQTFKPIKQTAGGSLTAASTAVPPAMKSAPQH